MTDPTSRLLLGTLYTQYLDADAADHPELSGVGNFRIEVYIGQAMFEQANDKYGLFKTTVAQHLASSIFDTQVPAEMWILEPVLKVRVAFNLPEIMPMKR
jgi:hypothetical protein